MAAVTLKKVYKHFGEIEAIHGIDLEIVDNEFIVLVGPSGCGKSTCLRMIAGLESISSGEIHIADKLVNNVAPRNRNIAMVFQNYALYPHKTVYENIAFGLRLRKTPKDEIDRKVNRAAEIIGLTPFLGRKPSALSGGQRQRVAMGRAIVRKPHVFLFDEPLSNLDAKLRTVMRMEIKKLHMRLKTTTVYVTHDQTEAMTLADRIVVMKDGYIEQTGTPIELFDSPANIFVATFIGSPAMNMHDGALRQTEDGFRLDLKGVSLPVPTGYHGGLQAGRAVRMGLRPTEIYVASAGEHLPEAWRFDARVIVIEPLGTETLVNFKIGDREFVGAFEGHRLFAPDEVIKVAFNLEKLYVFDSVTERNLAK